jgi:RES domain-containing protein
MPDGRLLAAIDALEPLALATEAFRHVAHDRHPLSGAGARLHGGRWNPPESFSTLYLALARDTTIAEFNRLAARQGRSPEDFLPRRMYRYEVVLSAVVDLRDPSSRARLDLDEAALRSNDAAHCRKVGATVHRLGLEGILAPSATGQGVVLVVFIDCLHADSHVRDLDYEVWTAPPPRS